MKKEKRIVFLSTFLHTGLDWIHSLLDGHPEILLMPALSFYRCYIKLNLVNEKNNEVVYNKLYEYISKNIGPNCENEQKKFINSFKEMEDFFFKLKQELSIIEINRKNIFFAIHSSYAYAKKINIDDIKVIISHETLPFYKTFIKKDFPNSKMLLILRDPRASLAGYWYRRAKEFGGYIPDYTFNHSLDCWLYGIGIVKDSFYTINKNLYIIKNEDMHLNLQNEMKKLALWLNIQFYQSMLKESYPSGKKVLVDSAYLWNDLQNDFKNYEERIPDNFFSKENIKLRWMENLSQSQILMIEELFDYVFKIYNYKKIYKSNFIKIIRAYYCFLIPQKNLLIKWSKDYPGIDAFNRIEKRLEKNQRYILKKVWLLNPYIFRYAFLFSYSMISRLKIIYSSKDSIPTYDKIK